MLEYSTCTKKNAEFCECRERWSGGKVGKPERNPREIEKGDNTYQIITKSSVSKEFNEEGTSVHIGCAK